MNNRKWLSILKIILTVLLLTGIRPPLLDARTPLSDSEVAVQLGKDIGMIAAEATASNNIPKFKREIALHEYCAVLLHLTEQVALDKFGSKALNDFMISIDTGLMSQLSILKSEGVLNPDRNIGEVSRLIKIRRKMYAKYDKQYSGSLPWAFGKWMAKILDSSRDINVILEHTYTMWHSFEKLKVTDRVISLNTQSDY
jgi:hypothetical protein